MIFEQNTLVFEILDVFKVKQSNVKVCTSGRNFDALSFRYKAHSLIETKNTKALLTDGSVGFFPSKVDYTRTTREDDLIVIHFNLFNYHSNEIEFFYPKDSEKYRSLFYEILNCWKKKDTSYKHEASAILYKIFAQCFRDNKPCHSPDSRIADSVSYIQKNCLKPDFSLKKAAGLSYVSEVYFRKLFKEEFGVSAKKYIINKRIKHAAALINTGYYSLQEIALMCGYKDYKYFSVEFKSIMGVSPSRYTCSIHP